MRPGVIFLRKPILCCCLLLCLSIVAAAQSRNDSYQVFAGYTRLSNSFNGLPGKQHGLNGWEVSLGLPPKHGLKMVLDYVSFYGTNQGAPQKGFFAMGGAQYERYIGREGIFAEGLLGSANIAHNWYGHGGLSTTASFTEFLGGGVDTPLGHSLAFRVKAGVQHTNFALMINKIVPYPYYRPAGLPENFGRVTAGVVWTHHRSAKAEAELIRKEEDPATHLKDTDLVFEGEGSFGHYKLLAGTYTSYLHVAGVEYDRNTWGTLWGAQMDYVAEVLPLVLLREAKVATDYGNDLTPGQFQGLVGLAITPIGLKMTWLHNRRVSPFLIAKGGVIVFNEKALAPDASYENLTLQETVGVQVHMTHRWGVRMGVGDFHFSNAFVVPTDPGVDEMMWKVGLVRHLGKTRWIF